MDEKMKKVRKKSYAFSIFIFMILSFITIGTGIVMFVSEEAGIYTEDKEDVIAKYDRQIMRKYAVYAIANLNNQYGFEKLKNTNFRYGIIKTSAYDELMKFDIDNYDFYCFDEKFDKLLKNQEDIYVFSTYYNENTWVDYEPHLFGYSYISNNNQNSGKETNAPKYYVISYLSPTLIKADNFDDCDFFVQLRVLVNIAYFIRYINVVVFVASLIIEILILIYIYNSIRKKVDILGDEETDKKYMPVDLSFLLAFTAISIIITICGGYFASLTDYGIAMFRSPILWMLLIIGGCLCNIILMVWFKSFAYQINKNGLISSTLCGKLLRMIWSLIRKIWNGIIDIMGRGSVKIPFIIILPIFAVEQLVVVLITGFSDAGYGIVAVLFEIIILVLMAVIFLPSIDKILNAGKELAEGNIDYRLDTDDMSGQIKMHGDNLNSIGSVLNQAVEERIKSETFKTQLITNVSHDIKTPLTSIINYVDLLEKMEFEDADAKEYIEVLVRQSGKLKKLIEDLIEASKASTGSMSVEMTTLDADVILDQVAGEFQDRFIASNLELVISKARDKVLIEADGRHLWRVFDNLLSNICKYAMPGTRAYIDINSDSDYTYLTFKNISREALNISSDELLERFVRADESRHTEGNGLGLSIAQSLMELMGGKLVLTVDGDLFKIVLRFSNAVSQN